MTLPTFDFRNFDPEALFRFHDSYLALKDWPSEALRTAKDMPWQLIEENHFYNCSLWNEEDLARRTRVDDSEIAKNKRAIDGFNQRRNDAIERIDDFLLQQLAAYATAADAILNSETAGSIVDRLSILSLKIFHMGKQTERPEVEESHRQVSRERLARLNAQRQDLGRCLAELLAGAVAGDRYFKIYRQFKMYNDPKFNPQIYGEQK